MRAKRLTALLLVLLLALAVTACGAKDNSKEATKEETATTSTASSSGSTLQEKYENGDTFLKAYITSAENEEGVSCSFEGNNIIMEIPMNGVGTLSEVDRQNMGAYFEDQEIKTSLKEAMGIVSNSTGIEDLSLTYRYKGSNGDLLYEITFTPEDLQ